MFNPLINTKRLAEPVLRERINELTEKYFKTNNPFMKEQIATAIQTLEDEKRRREDKKRKDDDELDDLNDLVKVK